MLSISPGRMLQMISKIMAEIRDFYKKIYRRFFSYVIFLCQKPELGGFAKRGGLLHQHMKDSLDHT